MSMEMSLVLIKPDAMQKRSAGAIISRLEGQGFKLAALKMLQLDEASATRHYDIHIGKPFFDDLIKYIISTPIVAIVFEGENAVEEIRETVGATDSAKAEPGTIRADFGSDVQHNAVHASDSKETAEKEIGLFFAGGEIFDY